MGLGFHPRVGCLHAKVFSLFELHGLIDDRIVAVRFVMPSRLGDNYGNGALLSTSSAVSHVLDKFASTNGATVLFGGIFTNTNIMVYISLEPCCHVGCMLPCTLYLVATGVRCAIMGCRELSPRVDDGGMQVQMDIDIDICVLGEGKFVVGSSDKGRKTSGYGEMEAAMECHDCNHWDQCEILTMLSMEGDEGRSGALWGG